MCALVGVEQFANGLWTWPLSHRLGGTRRNILTRSSATEGFWHVRGDFDFDQSISINWAEVLLPGRTLRI